MDDTQEPFAPYTVLQRTAACIGGILVFFLFFFIDQLPGVIITRILRPALSPSPSSLFLLCLDLLVRFLLTGQWVGSK